MTDVVDLSTILTFAVEDAEGTDPANASDVDELVRSLAAIRDARRRLAQVETVWEAELVASSEPGMRAAGFEIRHHWKGSTSDKWDRESAFRAALEAVGGDVAGLNECFRMEPRVTGLKKFGVNPDLYRERSTTGRMTIELAPDTEVAAS